MNRRRLAGLLLAALVPLAAWALTAAFLGGEEFARALLWERWAGRVVRSTDHAHPVWFYLPVVACGALPLAFVLLRREAADGHGTTERVTHRLALALLALLVVFSLISGKQPHYLEPLLPAAALLAAARLERRRELGSALRHGFALYFALLVVVSVALAALAPRALDSFSTGGQALVASSGHLPALALVALAGLAGFALTFRPQLPVGARLVRGCVCALLAFLPLHWLLGRLLFPHELARILRGSDAPVAHLGSSQHGAYAWLASPRLVPKLTSTAEVHAWWSEHPGGLLILDEDESAKLPPEAELVGREVLHRSNVLVARARSAGR